MICSRRDSSGSAASCEGRALRTAAAWLPSAGRNRAATAGCSATSNSSPTRVPSVQTGRAARLSSPGRRSHTCASGLCRSAFKFADLVLGNEPASFQFAHPGQLLADQAALFAVGLGLVFGRADLRPALIGTLVEHPALGRQRFLLCAQYLPLAEQGLVGKRPVFLRQVGEFGRIDKGRAPGQLRLEPLALGHQGDPFAGQAAFVGHQPRLRDHRQLVTGLDQLSLGYIEFGNDPALAVLDQLTAARNLDDALGDGPGIERDQCGAAEQDSEEGPGNPDPAADFGLGRIGLGDLLFHRSCIE